MKTELCAFSLYKIYPGHGRRMVRTDGKLIYFRDTKCRLLFARKCKPIKFRWTQVYRRVHKIKKAVVVKKKTHRVVKVKRSIEGLPLDVIKMRMSQSPQERAAAREAASAEVKRRRELLKTKKRNTDKLPAAVGPRQRAERTKSLHKGR